MSNHSMNASYEEKPLKMSEDLSFSKALTQSFIGHISILLFILVKTFFFPSEPLIFQNAIQVDIVALPEKNISPSKTIPPVSEIPPQTSPITPAPEKVETIKDTKTSPIKLENSQTRKKAKDQALARIKALQELEEEEIKNHQPKKELKGNVLSEGNSLTGINQIQHRNYIKELDDHVKKHWILPQWLANAKLKAKVKVNIDASGVILKKTMISSSGNPIYDEIVMSAIDKASPFPAPPDKFANIVSIHGVEFGFPE